MIKKKKKIQGSKWSFWNFFCPPFLVSLTGTLCVDFYWRLDIHSALGTWVFSVAGALLAIPVGIKRKSLAPLVFFGTTGTMLDIIMGISACEREHAERQMKLLEEAQNSAPQSSLNDSNSHSWFFANTVVSPVRIVPCLMTFSSPNCVKWWTLLWHGLWLGLFSLLSNHSDIASVMVHEIVCLGFIDLQ